MLEIDDAVSQGASADLHEASLAGLSSEEADRLREARRCLELLYNSRRENRPGEKGLKSTLLFDVDNPPLAPGAECAESNRPAVPISLEIDAGADRKRLGRFEVVRELGRGDRELSFCGAIRDSIVSSRSRFHGLNSSCPPSCGDGS